MIVMLRQVVVGWEVLLIEVQAVALSALKPNFSCPYHWSLRRVSRCNTEGMRGGGGGGGGSILNHGGGRRGRRCGTTGDSRGAVGRGRRTAAIGPLG